jgi:hypothetical protein
MYVAVVVPWVTWFGVMAINANSGSRRMTSIYVLLTVPIGAPLVGFVFLWIVNGFCRRAKD